MAPGDKPTCVSFRPPSTIPDSAAAAVAGSLAAAVLGATTGRSPDGMPDQVVLSAQAEEAADAAVAEYHLAVGYTSGCVRVFHVPSAQMVEEYRQHDAPVRKLAFAAPGPAAQYMRRSRDSAEAWALQSEPAAQRAQPLLLLSAGEDGRLVVHDALHGYVPVRVLVISNPPRGVECICAGVGLDVSSDGGLVAASFAWSDSGDSRGGGGMVLETFGFTAVSRLRVPGVAATRAATSRTSNPLEVQGKRDRERDLLRAGIAADGEGVSADTVSSRMQPSVASVKFLHAGG